MKATTTTFIITPLAALAASVAVGDATRGKSTLGRERKRERGREREKRETLIL